MRRSKACIVGFLMVWCSSTLVAQVRGYIEAGANYSIISDCEYDVKPSAMSGGSSSLLNTHYKQENTNDYGVQFAAGAFLQRQWFNYALGIEYSTVNFGTNSQIQSLYYAMGFAPSYPNVLPNNNILTISNSSFKSKLTFLSMPLIIETYASENKRVSIGGGIVPELLLDSKTSRPIDSKVRNVGCSWQAQIKMQITSRIAVVGSYRQNFTSIYEEGTMQSTSTKNRTARIAIRYIIGKKM